jgi:hypothetical protein
MPEIPLGFSFEEDDNGFILRRGDVEMRMSKEEFFSLKAQFNLWSERTLSQFQARTGEVKAIVSHSIAKVAVWPDAIQENVLLTLTSTAGTQIIFSLPILVAEGLAVALPGVLARMHPSSMT